MNHISTIGIISTIVLGISSILPIIKDRKQNLIIYNWAMLSVTIIAVVIAIFSIVLMDRKQKAEEKITAQYGELKPIPRLLIARSGEISPGVVVKFGPKAYTITARGIDILNNVLTITQINGQIKLSAKIRDKTGALLGELVNNEWSLNKNSIYDRNYNETALEVINNNGNVVFQAKFKNDTLELQGVAYDENGSGIAFWGGPTGTGLFGFGGKPGEALVIPIERLFKYPSGKYLGEFAENQK